MSVFGMSLQRRNGRSMRLNLVPILVFAVAFAWQAVAVAQNRQAPDVDPPPNILWITAEDMSPTLGCYGDDFATTPHLDRLASEGVRYTNAFATAPVCSPSRSCLINGLSAVSQGTHPMRSAFAIPDFMTGFPSFLRKHGYYTTNNVKTDYNSSRSKAIIAESWDENSDTAHWRGRQPDRPFFAVFNLMTSHQSRTMVWPEEKFKSEVQANLQPDEIHLPDDVPLPPYYPDTPVVRKTVARYYDCVTAMDKQVGAILKELEDDNLDDNTIVFFYSDHGSGMPRHKRALLDSGMKIPLIVSVSRKAQRICTRQTRNHTRSTGQLRRLWSDGAESCRGQSTRLHVGPSVSRAGPRAAA